MRLLHTKTLQVKSFSTEIPPYAILSHTWEEEEVTLQDIRNREQVTTLKGFAKVQGCCRLARSEGYQWIWIDTCCIDKTSSAELSETINSMYKWYQKSSVCYVYLADVPQYSDVELFLLQERYRNPSTHDAASKEVLGQSRWFSRGWTLQELIAPPYIEFYGEAWARLGTKSSLMGFLTARTGIPADALSGKPPSRYCVSERMSWVKGRETTREEDLAYCLLGLFDINMPLLYGEGEKAFFRLQEEIFRRTEDLSILAWVDKADVNPKSRVRGLLEKPRGGVSALATSPSFFDLGDGEVYRDILSGAAEERSWVVPPFTRSLVTQLQHNPPMITSRGVIMTMLITKLRAHEYVAWTNTGASIKEVENLEPSYAAFHRSKLSAPKAVLICIALRRDKGSACPLEAQPGTSQPVLMKRSQQYKLHYRYLEELSDFRARQICLSFDFTENKMDIGPSLQMPMDYDMPIRIKTGHRQHSIKITDCGEPQIVCLKDSSGYMIGFTAHKLLERRVEPLRNAWQSMRVLGVTKLEVECVPFVSTSEEKSVQCHTKSIFSVFVAWGIGGVLQRIHFALAPLNATEFTMAEASRATFTDQQYIWLPCGSMIFIKTKNLDAGPRVSPVAEIHVTG